ncbi:hypothetical protein AA313_de0203174 [Arthrobotrys entomopaga]|nr:hypothetical protein AA313_de0203174 [Arthrobotrys entomopaga]
MEFHPSASDFQIAVICALRQESNAVEAIFDKFWEEDPAFMIKKAEWDTNVYTTGKIGQHNVVLAHMGDYGKSNSASVASNLRYTFPAVRVAFIVGVCGGAPKGDGHDIWLGDVVISTGIVEYDLGRQMPHRFQAINPLGSKPNVELQAYLRKMQGERERWQLQQDAIKYLADPAPTLGQAKPKYPGLYKDKLFNPDHRHKHYKEQKCELCAGCLDDGGVVCLASEKADCETLGCYDLVVRERLSNNASSSVYPTNSPHFRIHFGLVGSADRVLRSASERDRLAQEYNLIAFEMEGAGAWEKIPCFIIKGVCDYSDSHKNKDWQDYAATTAAACLKAFLVPWRQAATTSHTAEMSAPSSHERLSQRVGQPGTSTGSQHPLNADLPTAGNRSEQNRVGKEPGDDLLDKFLEDLCEKDPHNEKLRIEGDKGGLLEDCYVWILDNAQFQNWQGSEETQMLWMRGDPGKGKTMLVIGLVGFLTNQPKDEPTALTYFFCQNTVPYLNNGVSVLRGLIWKLLWNHRTLGKYIPDEYRCKGSSRGQEILEGPGAFIILSAMLSAMLRDRSLGRIYLLVDALDECDRDMDRLAEWISKDASDPLSKAKWLVSSRGTAEIEEAFSLEDHQQMLSLELAETCISQAVDSFIEHKIRDLAKKKRYNPRTEKEVKQTLKEKAGSTFLWVALVCKSLYSVSPWKTIAALEEFPSGLQQLYERMLQLIEDREESDGELCKQILRVATLAYRPLSLEELFLVTGFPDELREYIPQLVAQCGSFLTLRRGTIYFVHQSAKDYISESLKIFPHGQIEEHGRIASQLLEVMTLLHRDMYNLQDPGFPVDDVVTTDPDPLASVRYACVYWVNHLSETSGDLYDKVGLCNGGAIDVFLKKHFLHWLEALSLMGNTSDAVATIRKLGKLLAFEGEIPSWILRLPDVPEEWGPLLQTFENWMSPFGEMTIVFSPDGKIAASAQDRAIRVWDVETGTTLRCLEFSDNRAIAISPSGEIASLSWEGNIMLWNIATGSGREIFSLSDGDARVYDFLCAVMVFSSNNLLVASPDDGYYGGSTRGIGLWNVETDFFRLLKFDSNGPPAVAFSPDGKLLVAGSSSGIMEMWDTTTGANLKTFRSSSDGRVWGLAISPDNKLVASAQNNNVVQLWDVATKTLQHTLPGCSDTSHFEGLDNMPVAFSPDSKTVVSSCHHCYAVKLWSTTTGAVFQTLEGHHTWILALVFSPDGKLLASGSNDGTVKLWDVVPSQNPQAGGSNGYHHQYTVVSPDGKLVLSKSTDHTALSSTSLLIIRK